MNVLLIKLKLKIIKLLNNNEIKKDQFFNFQKKKVKY